jgi:RNA polymerase sigma factor (sigma-70 family)
VPPAAESASCASRSQRLIDQLLERRPLFVSYVDGLVKDRSLAEDVVQEGFVRAFEHLGEVRDDGAVLSWFYRLLRNMAYDHGRRARGQRVALDAFAKEFETVEQTVGDAKGRPCRCVSHLAASLKPEYVDALQRIEVEGSPVKTFAAERGISPSNAAVRAFRARQALEHSVNAYCGSCAEGGCASCSCDVQA